MPMPSPLLTLAIAIAAEVAATTCLKASHGFTRPWPTLATVAGYVLSFWCLSLTLRGMPTGIAYAIWSGVGLVLITLLDWRLFGQSLDALALGGMALILAGVLVIQLGSAHAGRT